MLSGQCPLDIDSMFTWWWPSINTVNSFDVASIKFYSIKVDFIQHPLMFGDWREREANLFTINCLFSTYWKQETVFKLCNITHRFADWENESKSIISIKYRARGSLCSLI